MPNFPYVPKAPGVPAVFRNAGAAFVGAISGTTLSVSSLTSGVVAVGQSITGGAVALGTQITGLIGGSGGLGTYAVNIAQDVSSQAMTVLGNLNIPGVAPLTGDGPGINSIAATTPQWGLMDSDGNLVITPDSVVNMRFRHEFKDSDFPIEQGSFSSYNKVATPFEGWFTFNKGGMLADRTQFLTSLESVVTDTNLYVFATPELSYPNVNLEEYDYERSAEKGFQLIPADLHLVEIRVAASPTFSNTADPTAQSPTNNGSVQPTTPTTAQVTQAQAGLNKAQGVGTLQPGAPADTSSDNKTSPSG